MTGREKGDLLILLNRSDCLIEVTVRARLTVYTFNK